MSGLIILSICSWLGMGLLIYVVMLMPGPTIDDVNDTAVDIGLIIVMTCILWPVSIYLYYKYVNGAD